ncbi:MAG: hypothetical protein ACOX87_07605, partial [Chloroflexota bacterium]
GTEKTLSLESGNGLNWVLTIPAGALDHPETITMTDMKNVSSSLGDISGGVVLQPDGLSFTVPATLSVRGAGIETSGLLFSGNGKGEELELSIVQRNQDAVEMTLFHFSTAYVSNDDTVIAGLAQDARDSIRKMSALAKQILKRPIEVPVPPAIPIKCHHDTEDQDAKKLEKYRNDFGKPEEGIISALIAAKRNLALTTGESTDYTVELRLVNRLIKKGNMLIRQYKGQEDMFYAVSMVTLDAERQSALLGESLSEDYSFMPVLAEWAYSIAQKYLDGLVRNHEYKNIHPVIKLAATLAALSPPKGNSFLEQLQQALTFQLETMNTVTIGVAPSLVTYEVESKAETRALTESKTGMVRANGTGTYKSFKVPPLEGSELKLELKQLGSAFDVLVGIEGFLPCMSDTFTIYVDRFGAESETITSFVPETPPTSKEKPVVQMTCEKGFADRKKDGLYAFVLTVRDGQEVAGEQTFTASDTGMDIRYEVKLTHTP